MSRDERPEGHADDWDAHWADFSASAALNPAQAYRFRLVRQRLKEAGLARGSRILDVGCGTGDFLQQCDSWFPGSELAGVEMSRTGVEITRRKMPRANVFQADLLTDGVPRELEGWASHAVCSEVLEHVDDPAQLLRVASTCLQAGAWIVVTVPGGPRTAYDRHIGHREHFSRARLARVMTQAGLRVHRVAAAGFPFHNLYRLTVLMRGNQLVTDAKTTAQGGTVQRLVLAAFGALFRANLRATPFGWQTIGVAQKPIQA